MVDKYDAFVSNQGRGKSSKTAETAETASSRGIGPPAFSYTGPPAFSDTYLEPEIDELLAFINGGAATEVKVLKKERVRQNLSLYTEALNTFLTYPDILSDIMTPKGSRFSMFFAQRITLRSMARSRQSFSTFTRAFSKSFLADYYSYVRSMCIPRCNGFTTAGTKNQAAQIAKEKIIQDL